MDIFKIKGASGAVANQSHSLGGRTLIGRADDCDVRIDADGVSAHHAAIVVDEDKAVWLEVLAGEGGVSVNGKLAVCDTGRVLELSSGDEIRIAGCRWVLQAPGLRPDKTLTADATRKKRRLFPWLAAAIALTAAAVAWSLYWGYLPL